MNRILVAASLALMVGTSSLAHAAVAELKPYKMDQSADMRASELIGQRIYATQADVEGQTLTQTQVAEYDDIGEVNDVILSGSGQVKAVVLGVGGFLGLGEKDVTIDLSSIRMVPDADREGARFMVINANKEQLTALATLEQETARAEETRKQEAEQAAAGTTDASGGAVEQTDQAATTEQPATEQPATDQAATEQPASGEQTDLAAVPGEALTEEQPAAEQAATTEQPAADATQTAESTDGQTTTVPIETVESTEQPATEQPAAEVAATTEGSTTVEVTEAQPVEGQTTGQATGDTGTVVVTTEQPVDGTVQQPQQTADAATTDATVVTTETAQREVFVRPTATIEGFQPLADTELTADTLRGARIYDTANQDVGEISDLVMSSDGTRVEQAVLDVGGFLGIGERQVAVPVQELQFVRNEGGEIRAVIQATQQQLEAQPAYAAD